MKALNSAFAEDRTIDEEEMYLFVFNSEAANVESGVLLGDMPISSQYGYIFKPDGESIAPKTIAHELGHGMFLLKHTFADSYGIDQGTTDNLMDYSTGTELVKQQWDAIYDPQLTLFAWLQDDEDGNYVADNTEQAVTGESDLLPIIVSKASYGYFRFTISTGGGNIKIWENADGSIPIAMNTSFEAPETDKTYYVEGIQKGELILTLSWNKKEDFSKSDVLTDEIKLNIAEITGVINAPNYSKYTYEILYAGSTIGSWDNTINGTVISNSGSNEIIHWQAGPTIGQIQYVFNENYKWCYEVNVVDITIIPKAGAGTNSFIDIPYTPHKPTLLYRSSYNRISTEFGPFFSSGDKASFAHPYSIISKMKVSAVGPDYNTVFNRGVEKMEVGFVQNIQFTRMEASYADGTTLYGNIAGVSYYIDKDVIATKPNIPYYSSAAFYNSFTASNSLNKDIEFQDRPTAYFKRYVPSQPQSLAYHWQDGYWEENFDIWICSRSLDETSDLTATYTILKKASWSFVVDDNATNIDIPNTSGIYPISVGDRVNGSITLPTTFMFTNETNGDTPTTIGGNTGNYYLQNILIYNP